MKVLCELLAPDRLLPEECSGLYNMGIPKFFRWLSERYPLINQPASQMPEVDNFYLDMNGIVHVAASSNSIGGFIPHLLPRKSLNEIWQQVFKYLDTLVALVQPQKLLYLSFDGVPPRAKMNNQRERRYKAVYEVENFVEEEAKRGREVTTEWFNSSQISPGTAFMIELNREIRAFIKYKIQTDPVWRRIRVVFSGTDVVGEGEHKIQQYFRCTQFPPDTRHCIYGLDADLILLGLITHQPYVFLLREEVSIGNIRSFPDRIHDGEELRFQCLYLNVLREYLHEEFKQLAEMDVERFLDDLVVIMLFIGNDFLPRLPTFEIDTGAIDQLFKYYTENWKEHGYLCSDGKLHWAALIPYIQRLPVFEAQSLEKKIKDSTGRRRQVDAPLQPTTKQGSLASFSRQIQGGDQEDQVIELELDIEEDKDYDAMIHDSTQSAVDRLTAFMEKGTGAIKRMYYKEFLELDYSAEKSKLKDIIYKYCEGFQWVLTYYFDNEIDWQWYYPMNYAPMVSDFAELLPQIPLDTIHIEYKEPYLPLEQLLCVLPPFSANLLPPEYAAVMYTEEFCSMFPEKPGIEYDVLCSKINWASLKVVVPFVDFERVFKVTRSIPSTPEIDERNRVIPDIAYWFDNTVPMQTIEPGSGVFPSRDCTVAEEALQYDLSQHFARNVPAGTSPVLPGFPSLHYLQFSSELKYIGVNLFNSPSRYMTLELTLQQINLALPKAYNQFYNKVVYIGYPHQRVCLVDQVISPEKALPALKKETLGDTPLAEYLLLKRGQLWTQLSTKSGMSVYPELGILLRCLPLKHWTRSLQGVLKPAFDEVEYEWVPLEMAMLDSDTKPKPPETLQDEFPLGSKVVVLAHEHYGALGEVIGYGVDKVNPLGAVQVRLLKTPKQLKQQMNIVAASHYDHHYTVGDLAKRVKRPVGLLVRLLGSFKIFVKIKGRVKIYELGFNLRNDKEYTAILKYARWGGYWNPNVMEWQYSERTEALLQEYLRRFPQFWESLSQLWTTKGVRKFQFADIFQYTEHGFREVEDIALWVRQQPCSKMRWSSVYSEYLSPQVMTHIKEVVSHTPPQCPREELLLNPGLLFIESKSWTPPFARNWVVPRIGHRVVNLNTGGIPAVPLGAEGTVVGLRSTRFVDVMLDEYLFNSDVDNTVTLPTLHILNITQQAEHSLRKGNEEESKVNAWSLTDFNFKPQIGRRPNKRAQEEAKQVVSHAREQTITLNPSAATFTPESIDLQTLFSQPQPLEGASQKTSQETSQETCQELPRGIPQESPQEAPQEPSQELFQEPPQGIPQSISVEALFRSAALASEEERKGEEPSPESLPMPDSMKSD